MSRTTSLLIGSIMAFCFAVEPSFAQSTAGAQDKYGDPLPEGAVARLGSERWRHPAPVYCVAFTADGNNVVSAGGDGFFRVWEYPSGKELRRFGPGWAERTQDFLGDRSIGYSAPFAISSDGKRTVIFGERGITLYDVATGNEEATFELPDDEKEQHSTVASVAFSHDSQQLAAQSSAGTVFLWDIVNRKMTRKFGESTGRYEGRVLAISANGKIVLTASKAWPGADSPQTLLVWNATTGEKLRADPLPKGFSICSGCSFSPDGKLIAIAINPEGIFLVDTETGKLLRKLESTDGPTTRPLFSHDGSTLYGRVSQFAVEEWDVTTEKSRRRLGKDSAFFYRGITSMPLALSPDGATLAFGGAGNRIQFIDLADGKKRLPDGHGSAVNWLQFAPDGQRLWTKDTQNNVCLWEYFHAKALAAPQLPSENSDTRISQDGRYVIQSAGYWESVKAIDLVSQKETEFKSPRDKVLYPFRTSLAPDGKTVAVRWHQLRKLELHDVPSLQLRHTFPIKTGHFLPGEKREQEIDTKGIMIFSPNGTYFAACSDLKTLSIWNTVTGRKTADLPLPAAEFSLNAAFTPDNRCLLLDFEDGTIDLVEISSAQVRRSFGTRLVMPKGTFPPRGDFGGSDLLAQSPKVAMTPDCRLLVHGGPDKVVRVYDVPTGKEIARYQGHEGAILAVAVSNDGKYAATASSDTTVLLWKLPETENKGK